MSSTKTEAVCVFSAPHLANAKMVQAALQTAGLTATVRGEQLNNLAGAIPVDQTYAQVLVAAKDADAAKKIVADHTATSSDEVRCAQCSCENPAHFSVCWSCDANLANALPTDPNAPDAVSSAAAFTALPPKKASLFWPVVASGFAVLSAVAGLGWLQARGEVDRLMNTGRQLSTWDTDSGCLTTVSRATGKRISTSCDLDFDDNFESITYFDDSGRRTSFHFDADSNLIDDILVVYRASGETEIWYDDDQDRRYERRVLFNTDHDPIAIETDSPTGFIKSDVPQSEVATLKMLRRHLAQDTLSMTAHLYR